MTRDPKDLLLRLFRAAVDSANPAKTIAQHLPDPPLGRVVVVGAGKSAAAMAAAVEAAWPNVDLSGVVVTRYGHAVPTRQIEVLQAAHPVPDANGAIAAQRILQAVSGLGPDDLVLALISGGGSALMTAPAPSLTLDEKMQVNRLLLASGAPISVMNRVRRRLSAIKGGRLALAAAPARVVTLAISDVPGDDPLAIASGPTVWDPDAAMDMSAIAAQLGDDLPPSARRLLLETPAPLPRFDANYRMISTPLLALRAAADLARAEGITPLILGDAIEGEAAAAGQVMAGIAQSAALHGLPVKGPAVLLSGGETTVTIGAVKPGRGGRNTEFLLSMASALNGANIHALACDTDGIDGSEDAAGAIVTPDTLLRARAAGLDPAAMLARHDSYSLFSRIGDLVTTGPTLTNVNDFRAVYIP
ncbi:glycerate kinase type-2 family protein [Paracoccus laeviglucosivorans]|uniref:Hydroxypyruvate reductase n=1 Tax=Paracoccus laeviglucosivorans TaxID=1197861 RepID=A0A521FEZ4_9RHOB|nr:glycerate kinase [Paracoccus laeviglucosivorans]SMO94753.1 hydroxypyruvate reductase [Paracoccus laeviglucosivorans]